MSCSIKPRGHQIIVKPEKRKEKTDKGIYIPETASKEPVWIGTVRAVGSGVVNENGIKIPCESVVDDKVMYHAHAGTEVEIDGEKVVILSDLHVLAVI